MDKDNGQTPQVHLTPEGLEDLRREYEQLLNEKRPKVVERLANARSLGDLSENNDYITAKEELEFLDGRIVELERVLNNVVVIKNSFGKKREVTLGTRVTVHVNGIRHTFHIVGEWEADPKNQRISHESPLGRALLGKKVGDEVTVEAPVGKLAYKVLAIE